MNNQFYPQEFHEALTVLEYFTDKSINILRSEKDWIKYFGADALMINLLAVIPTLTYLLKEFALTNNESHKSVLREQIHYSVADIEENFLSLAVNCLTMDEAMQVVWRSLLVVNKVLQNVLNYRFSFDFDKIMEEIEERREDGDKYCEDNPMNN